MLYESDVTNLLTQWQERFDMKGVDASYKDALGDCIYDLKSLVDKNFAEEALAQESYDQQLMKAGDWDTWFDNLIADEMLEQ